MIVTRMASNHSNSAARVKEVVDRAKEIIENHFPDNIYHVTFHQNKKGRSATVITIYNRALPPNEKIGSPHGYHCMKCQIYENDPNTFHIGLLTRCGLNGTDHLNRLIAFSKACGFSRITLEDASNIHYVLQGGPPIPSIANKHYISLQKLLRLKTGHSWYEKFGFSNEIIEGHRKGIERHILKPIGSLYPEELRNTIQDYVEIILSASNPASNPESEVKITKNTSVSEAASYLYDCLKIICPDRICPDEEGLAIVDHINNIIDQMFDRMLVELEMTEEDFQEELVLLLANQKGSSRTRRKNKTARRRKRTLRR
jgi:hypothetical protein